MRSRTLLTCTMLLGAILTLGAGSTAFAQATRTWISGVGDDVNPCSRTAPCKTFQGAIAKTAAGGEINTLDPGGFGAVTITKSITIDAHNVLGGVLVSGTNGIVINAGVNDVVTLRGLNITGLNSGLAGVRYIKAAAVHVEDCFISGFTQGAISFLPDTGVSGSLFVRRVTASNNGGGGVVVGGLGSPVVTIQKSSFLNDVIALHATDSAVVSVYDSVIAGNATTGVWAEGTATVNIERGLISGNGVGVQGDSTVRLSDVMIGHNTTGLAGAKVISFGNNRVSAGNGSDGAPTSTVTQQ
jgi:hypothetical protein